ncbi:MAG TPA: DnaJ domain-containing protein [Candidatus Binatia bacterium]|nr:DnaJ domain-containing protein [Candidatus Binatia bacterium]
MNWFKQLFGTKSNGEAQPEESDSIPKAAEPGREPIPAELVTRKAPNLVDGINALAMYYRYLEAEAYDRGLKTMREHRDFRDEFLNRANAVLLYERDPDAQDQIALAIARETAAFSVSPAMVVGDSAAEARSRDPQGYALLDLTPPLTLENLRAAYRRAALAYHPDVGGDNETMRRINDAYELFSAVIRRRVAQETLATGSQPIVANDVDSFFVRVRFGKLSMLLDDLAADAAFEVYNTLSIANLEAQFRSWDLVAKLCELLAACNRPDDAKRVLHDLGTLVEDGGKRELILGPIYRKASEACCDPKAIRFIPNHGRQADNLLRLGIIDQKRYDAILKRVGEAEERASDQEEAFEKFAASYRFLQLPMDPAVDSLRITGLMPGPDYYARVETMSDAQRREYARAFHGGFVALTAKYLAVRMDALLRTPFVGCCDLNALLVELRALNTAPGMKPGLAALCKEAITVISFLASLPESQRAQRIAALKALDSVPGPTITVSPVGVRVSLPRPIMMNPAFTQFATGPIERIERYARTGSELTVEEQQENRRRWDETRAFHDSEPYKRARDATWQEKGPEAVVTAASALCDAMYERAVQTRDDSLEIGYWTDKLTIALVKLKRFDDALSWLRRFDDAPEAMKVRTARSVLDALHRRRSRCEAFTESNRSEQRQGE